MNLFQLGTVCVTRAVAECFDKATLFGLIQRHRSGDWGNLSDEDKELNQKSLQRGGRIFSSYLLEQDKVWVITESDRSTTTLLFPYEY